jgi:hypothetical protein
VVQDYNFDRVLLKQALSPFKYYCSVTWLIKKELHKCTHNHDACVLYKDQFFFFKSDKARDLFVQNPQRFIGRNTFPTELPTQLRYSKAAELGKTPKALGGHCPVTLVDDKRVQQGDQLLVVSFNETCFVFQDQQKMIKFYTNPFKYS